jgi:hypothetical protein
MAMFVERLLVDRAQESVPEAACYDEERQISLAADGAPFVAGPPSSLITLTEASGEAIDDADGDDEDDRRRVLASEVTLTLTDAEGIDEHGSPRPPNPPEDLLPLWGVTTTKAGGESPDAPLLATETRQAPGEAPGDEHGLWAVTKTEAGGESPDRPAAELDH